MIYKKYLLPFEPDIDYATVKVVGKEITTKAVLTTDFHANVTLIGEHDFSTAIEKPNSPKYGWQ